MGDIFDKYWMTIIIRDDKTFNTKVNKTADSKY